ncbi:hypothetical protein WJX84_009484 [Apatococcus fuscideae]|uniref:Uncharacterized protein n=1 Tax=Apatococcus fuscideae TaxID=2026836 RepID=A0AAW1SWF4_9CHLO
MPTSVGLPPAASRQTGCKWQVNAQPSWSQSQKRLLRGRIDLIETTSKQLGGLSRPTSRASQAWTLRTGL